MIVTLDQPEVGKEMLAALVTALNSDPGHIHVMLSNEGGECAYAEAISHLIDMNRDRITLIGFDVLASAAFGIFFEAKCNKMLLPSTLGMFHRSHVSTTFDSSGKPIHECDGFVIQRMKEIDHPKVEALIVSLGATQKELRSYRKGESVWLSTKRMAEMLEHQNKTK